MSDTNSADDARNVDPSRNAQVARAALQALGGALPFLGGFLSAAASAWSEQEQAHINRVFQQWLQMLEEELREKGRTIIEIMARLDMNDSRVRARVESSEYQSLLKKAFRNWQNVDSEEKRAKVRNLLSNAAATSLATDDVIRLFLDWIDEYSDFHFSVIGEIYRNGPISRGEIWSNLGRPRVREDSADADLFKLLIRDLSTGGVCRQEREVDAYGQYLKKASAASRQTSSSRSGTMESAFELEKLYVLTDLGKQFVHYAMNELAPRIEFDARI